MLLSFISKNTLHPATLEAFAWQRLPEYGQSANCGWMTDALLQTRLKRRFNEILKDDFSLRISHTRHRLNDASPSAPHHSELVVQASVPGEVLNFHLRAPQLHDPLFLPSLLTLHSHSTIHRSFPLWPSEHCHLSETFSTWPPSKNTESLT